MRNFLATILSVGLFILACNDDKKTAPADESDSSANVSANPDYTKGLKLVAGSDCFTCHLVDERINGPSYREVANKYAGKSDTTLSYLAGKIITGGSGVWGPVMMTPHPDLSKEDAEAMVKYVLLLKK